MTAFEPPLIDLSQESAGNAEETPIFTALFLEYREAQFKRLAEAVRKEEGLTGEDGTAQH